MWSSTGRAENGGCRGTLRRSHRIGGYVVAHTPGQVVIDLLWIATREDVSGQSCQLLYEGETGEPRAMEISVQKTLTLLLIRLAYISYVPWKKPKSD